MFSTLEIRSIRLITHFQGRTLRIACDLIGKNCHLIAKNLLLSRMNSFNSQLSSGTNEFFSMMSNDLDAHAFSGALDRAHSRFEIGCI